MTIVDRTAPTDHAILDVLQERWSPRAYEPVVIDEALLSKALEAARWSPSAYNAQPWRFVVARRGTEAFDQVVAALAEFNQLWAPNASVLIVAIAEVANEEGRANPTAVYDLGQAVAHLTIQAHADGLVVHQMSGFDAAAAAQSFGLEDRLQPVTVVALGSLGDAAALDAMLREREHAPRARKPLSEIVLGS
ncbi:nitroreductase family protein [Agrococcus jejuensis]|uniref:Nitroreductase n=1 Tax=Agrococcus jejuensis TaxID=399736 RepID=A0A1G8CBD2_9MICO|nr:nitroreductase family protein [Agrococcus jejuensis]SDH42170.1 Nitroreductase [Agrococcus jejuensis]